MTPPTLASQRLYLRAFSLDDADFILELLNTEGWIKYIGDRNVRTTQKARDYLTNGPLRSYQIHGFGLSLVELKDSHRPIGMCGLLQRDYLGDPDIGFSFLPAYMGKGYAYEIATEVIHYGFRELQLEKILAITLPENASSIKLLKALGFRLQNNFTTPDTHEELCLFSIDSTISQLT